MKLPLSGTLSISLHQQKIEMHLFTFPCKCPIFFTQNHLSLSFATFPSASSSLVLSASVSSSSVSSKSTSFTVDYLVNSCGFTSQSAIAASGKLSLSEDKIHRYDSLLHELRAYGFDNTHLAKLIQKFPSLLRYKADKNVKQKLEYLIENGFTDSHLHDLVTSNPSILSKSVSAHIEPSLKFLRSFLGSEERLRLAFKRYPRLLTTNVKATLQSNIELFVKEGVPVDAIAKFFVADPHSMFSKHEKMLVGLKTYKEQFGDSEVSPNQFLLAVTRIGSMDASSWNMKVQLFKSLFGVSQEEVLSLFRRYPTCFLLSEKMLRSKVDFYLNTAQLKPQAVISSPALLTYSMDRRIRPRYNVFKVLLSKKLLREETCHSNMFVIGEKKFLDRYVTRHLHRVPSLFEMYTNDKMKKQD